MGLSRNIRQRALELGFDHVGIARADRATHADAFHDWIAQGYHGDMAWLARDPERRCDPGRVVPNARSMIVCGVSYYTEDPPPELWNDPLRGRIARYAWGRDYHKVLTPRLRDLWSWLQGEVSSVNGRYYVDTGPILERDFAERAGLGFVGKHTLLITPRHGSYLFLGVLLVDLELEPDAPDAAAAPGTCGQCRRCLDICPTHAFPVPYVLDSRKCISYLTIELRGSIPTELRSLMGNWIFGCDACQSICPWVRQYAKPTEAPWLRPEPEVMCPRLEDLLALDDDGFLQRFAGTPVMRTKRRGLLRNAAVALGNSGRSEAAPILERAMVDVDPVIREHAAWGHAKIAEL